MTKAPTSINDLVTTVDRKLEKLGAQRASNIATTLLEKLKNINEAVRCGDSGAVASMVLEAEDCVLQMERDLMASLSENKRLRRPA